MAKKSVLLLFLYFSCSYIAFAQEFYLTQPRLDFDGTKLQVSYDIITDNSSDRFYVWLEIQRSNGEPIQAKSLEGDIGEFISGGTNKHIIWVPENDSVFLDEDISVEVKAEKYRKEFARGGVMFLSMLFPGLGQTVARKSSAGWLMGLTVYGAAAGGYLFNKKYIDNYDKYKNEDDPDIRTEYYNKSQLQNSLSKALLISAGVVWTINFIWAAAMPNNYRPLQHLNVSVGQPAGSNSYASMLTFKLNF